MVYQMDTRDIIKISKDTSDRITVAFSYDPPRIAKVKGIEAHSWMRAI